MRLRHSSLCLAALSIAWCAQDQATVWNDYLDWFRKQPAQSSPGRQAYIDHLKQAGLSPAAAAERAATVERLMRERRDEWHPVFFDRTYASATPRFNTQPNAFLVDVVRNVKPGRALDIHMGQGRNAIYLATQGWDVTGFDYSPVGVAAARNAAAAAGVRLTAQVCRHEDFDFGSNRWDLIVMSYTWVPLDEQWIGRIVGSLNPGGKLVFEHLMDESGSENKAAWLPRPNELPRLFAQLRILRYTDTFAKADWAWRPERLARLLAERDVALEQNQPGRR